MFLNKSQRIFFKYIFSKLKWLFKISRLVLKDSDFRDLFFKSQFKEANLSKQIDTLKELLRLNPAWTKGHYLIANVAFKKYQIEKNNQLKGLIRLSSLALLELKADPKLRSAVEDILESF